MELFVRKGSFPGEGKAAGNAEKFDQTLRFCGVVPSFRNQLYVQNKSTFTCSFSFQLLLRNPPIRAEIKKFKIL